jgi:hypothetical protein
MPPTFNKDIHLIPRDKSGIAIVTLSWTGIIKLIFGITLKLGHFFVRRGNWSL